MKNFIIPSVRSAVGQKIQQRQSWKRTKIKLSDTG